MSDDLNLNPLDRALQERGKPTKREAAAGRKSRASETRQQEGSVHGEDENRPWEHASNLASPPPRPGMAQRWIRTSTYGTDDPTNIAKALNEGWRPRMSDTVSEGFSSPKLTHGQFAGAIGIHGMILCEIPEARMAARKRYHEEKTRRQTQAVEQGLAQQSNPAMPLIHQRKTTVTKGKTPEAAADDS